MRRQRQPESCSSLLLLLLVMLVVPGPEQLQAEIAYSPLASNRISSDGESQEAAPVQPVAGCAQREAYEKLLHSIDDVEDLDVDVPVHIALEQRQKKR